MSRTELSRLLDAGAGPVPAGTDPAALWRRGRRRRRAKRAGVAGGGLTAVVLVAVAMSTLPNGAPDELEIEPAEAPRTATLPDVALPDAGAEPAQLRLLDEPTGALVIATRDHDATFVDVDRRQVTERPSPELAPGDPIARLVAGDRLVLYGGRHVYAMDAHPDAQPAPILTSDDLVVFVPSGVPDRVWVRRGGTDDEPAEITQVDVHGNVLVGPTESPGGSLVAGLRDAAVLHRDGDLIVWDPTTDRILETLPGPFPMGTDGGRIAWCDTPCRRLHLTDPDDGTRLLAEVPAGAAFSGYAGRLSPDGRHLATPTCVDAGDDRRCALAVLDLVAGRAWTVGDGWVDRVAPEPAWSPDGRWVFVPLDDGRLAAYRPGRDEVAVVDVPAMPRPYGFGVVDAP